MRSLVAWYREFAPREALRADVYALFSFVPGTASPLLPTSRQLLREVAFRRGTTCAPQLADGQVSLQFELGRACDAAGDWRDDSNALGATLVGPMSGVGRTEALDLSETVGAYFRPGRAFRFFGVPLAELADRAVALEDVWGPAAARLPDELVALSEAARLDRLELMLLSARRNERRETTLLDIDGLAAAVRRRSGRITVEEMAASSGVSRQHLAKVFRDRIGVGPKLYGRLSRFQSVLAYHGARAPIDWAAVALDMGFADQSHMIAECRRFSGLTPQAIADGDWFHPFMERAKVPVRSVDASQVHRPNTG